MINRARGAASEQVEQPPGVIAVRVGQPDPPDVGRVQHRAQGADEVAVRQPEPGIDDHGLRRVQDERVDRKEPQSGYLHLIVQDGDVPADSIRVHVARLFPILGVPFRTAQTRQQPAPLSATEGWAAGRGDPGRGADPPHPTPSRPGTHACPGDRAWSRHPNLCPKHTHRIASTARGRSGLRPNALQRSRRGVHRDPAIPVRPAGSAPGTCR